MAFLLPGRVSEYIVSALNTAWGIPRLPQRLYFYMNTRSGLNFVGPDQESEISLGMNSNDVIEMAVKALDDMKGVDLTVIDIIGKSSIADAMIVVTGTSGRHVRSLAESVRLSAKEANHPPLGVEGSDSSEWVLVDLGDVIVHVMTEEKREFYSLEKLWSVGPDEESSRNSVAGTL